MSTHRNLSKGSIPRDASRDLYSFQKYERLLWKIIATLAQQGYVTPPNDAQDLIHDFYVDVWSGLVERHDPSLGGFSAFLVSAFYRFARHRIVRLQSWRGRLAEVEHLRSRVGSSPPPEHMAELAEVRRAISGLEEPERSVLYGCLQGQSERSLCGQHGVSRYRIREVLIDAIGRVASVLGEIQTKHPVDAKVADALWREGRTIRDTAALLKLSVREVREAREHNIASILDSINRFSSQGSHQMHENPLELLKKALLTPDDGDLLHQVEEHANDILRSLDEGEVELSKEELEQLEDQYEWTAKVYEAFAHSEETPDEADDLTRVIEQMRMDEDREIAAAFMALLETLPSRFRQWEHWFAEVPRAPEEYQCYLYEQPIVVEGGPYAAELVPFGMTPGTFAEAARGVEVLLHRLIRKAFGPVEQYPSHQPELMRLYHWLRESGIPGMLLSLSAPLSGANGYVPSRLLLSQLRGTPGCPPEAAKPMLHWLIGAAQLKPFFFEGFRATTLGEAEIRLTEERTAHNADLLWRWGKHTEEHPIMSDYGRTRFS